MLAQGAIRHGPDHGTTGVGPRHTTTWTWPAGLRGYSMHHPLCSTHRREPPAWITDNPESEYDERTEAADEFGCILHDPRTPRGSMASS